MKGCSECEESENVRCSPPSRSPGPTGTAVAVSERALSCRPKMAQVAWLRCSAEDGETITALGDLHVIEWETFNPAVKKYLLQAVPLRGGDSLPALFEFHMVYGQGLCLLLVKDTRADVIDEITVGDRPVCLRSASPTPPPSRRPYPACRRTPARWL